MNCLRVALVAKLLLIIVLGFISFRLTPYSIEKEFRVQGL